MIDNILSNGTPNNPNDDYDAIVVPTTDTTIDIADRAGYPVLTVPVGYGATASGAGHNPIGVALIGTAFSEATLLDDGYALEQATNVRLAPSFTNPSMWRCVPGSTFFTDELCNPGDRHMLALGDQVTALGSTIEDLGLSSALTGKLADRATKIGQETGQPPAACSDLTGMIKDVFGRGRRGQAADDGGPGRWADRRRQRRSKSGLGCVDAGTPKARAELDVLGLIGTLDGLGGGKSGLRSTIVSIGKGLPGHTVASALPQAQRPDQGSRRRGRQEGPLGRGRGPAADRGLEDLLRPELLDAPRVGGRSDPPAHGVRLQPGFRRQARGDIEEQARELLLNRSAGGCCPLERRNVDLLHREHRIHHPLCLGWIWIGEQAWQGARDYLPGEPETVFQPTAPLCGLVCRQRLPEPVDLLLALAVDHERHRFVELELRAAVQRRERLPGERELDEQNHALRPARRVRR